MPLPETQHRVALLATDGFEQCELEEPRNALRAAGYVPVIVAPHAGSIQGWHHDKPGDTFSVDETLDHSDPASFDALVLPGGVMNPDALRIIPQAIAFIKHFVQTDKPIAAICHGPWPLINAHAVKGKRITSWPSLRMDLEHAGATWVDAEVVVDGMVITSRNPGDLPAFIHALLHALEHTTN